MTTDNPYAEGFNHGRQFEQIIQKRSIGARLEADLMGVTAKELREREGDVLPEEEEEVK